MMRLIYRALLALWIVMISWSPVASQDVPIKLFKKGTTVTLTEDLHCMTNATTLVLAKKLRLCPTECSLKLEELQKLYEVDLKTLNEKLALHYKKYTEIISEKDKTIDKIQVTAIDEISRIENSIWWKVTLGVIGGALVGAGVTVLVMEVTK